MKLGIKNPKVVGMVASFTEKKNYSTFLIAAQQLLSKRGDVSFVTVSDGEHFEKMKQVKR